MKYQLLLKDVLRYTERAQLAAERQDLMRAVEIMLVVPKSADDMMNVGRLQAFPGKLTAQGKLIKQGTLLFCDISALVASLEPGQQMELLAGCSSLSLRAARELDRVRGDQGESQFQLQQQQQHQQQSSNGSPMQRVPPSSLPPLSGASSISSAASSSSRQALLSAGCIGTSQMSDAARLILNKLLADSNNLSTGATKSSSQSAGGQLLKLRERQTFLFEQTIIFSEVLRKGGGGGSGAQAQVNKFNASHYSNQYNFHPCQPHSHNAQGAVELCCSNQDCPLAASGCDRLLGAPAQLLPASAAAPGGPQAARLSSTGQSIRRTLGERLRSHRDSAAFLASSLAGGGSGAGSGSSSASTRPDKDPSSLQAAGEQQVAAASNSEQEISKPNHLLFEPKLLQHHHHPLGGGGGELAANSATLAGGSGAAAAAAAGTASAYLPPPSYQYKNHLSINKVALIDKHYGPSVGLDALAQLFGPALDCDAESRRFMLRSRDPSQENVIFLLQTGCSLDRDDWVNSIRSMLECQLDFLRALQSPIAYQRGLTKEG